MRVPRRQIEIDSCDSVKDPRWPLSYSKFASHEIELKGRSSRNFEDFGHICTRQGVRSKCHICEDFSCGDDLSSECSIQLQGTNSTDMRKNIPVVSDTPWAQNGAHRNDFDGENVTHTCVMLSGGICITPSLANLNYSECSIRCWGYGLPHPTQRSSVILESHFYVANEEIINTMVTPSRSNISTEIWSYMSSNESLNASQNLKFNPQGYIFTLAGNGTAGFTDGNSSSAQFNNPYDVASDAQGNVYVADTGNHCIRKVDPNGFVSTIAGDGYDGYLEGVGLAARFSSPSGISVGFNENGEVLLYIADRGNHKIRIMDMSTGNVSCYAGRCGSSDPAPGFGDGAADIARFDAPTGLALDRETGYLFVADTNNHVIRMVRPNENRYVYTLGGHVESEMAYSNGSTVSCPLPCLRGVPGHLDGSLAESEFYYPTDVEITPSGEILVSMHHSIRLISLPGRISELQGVESEGRVSTLAGSGTQEGSMDSDQVGQATFNGPAGVAVSSDGVVFTTDSISCRIRRLTPTSISSPLIGCDSRLVDMIQPSGCSSYNPPFDDRDKTVGAVYGHIHYNFADYGSIDDNIDGKEIIGRQIKQCIGVPPIDIFQIYNSSNTTVDANLLTLKEDTGDGTLLHFRCPSNCALSNGTVIGGGDLAHSYADSSSICRAAIQSGVLSDLDGGLVTVVVLRGNVGIPGLDLNGINSTEASIYYARFFTVHGLNESSITVETIAGHPAAELEDGCGYTDAQPAQNSYLNSPMGIDMWQPRSSDPSQSTPSFLFVADTGNHAIRVLSTVCSFPCENGGTCRAILNGSGFGGCSCTYGWMGVDCTKPICTDLCPLRQVCVAPDYCNCIPGYSGLPSCTIPLCVQDCLHGSTCSAPDTCQCLPGWFGPSCNIPICSQTCGNGGNCTAPNTCSCPTNWTGGSCRIPVCSQTCLNGGWCTAPDTCTCPPQYTGYDCATPVCTQGSFSSQVIPGHVERWSSHVPCNYTEWCKDTNGFDCAQPLKQMFEDLPLWGPNYRAQTGWKDQPFPCLMIELEPLVVTQFSYLIGLNGTTPNMRYSIPSPLSIEYSENEPWYPPLNSSSWEPDRQVALVTRMDILEGKYFCANNGECVAPDKCACQAGWIGFDCRTPVCRAGYYDPSQTHFVSGFENVNEVQVFDKFMDPHQASNRLDWPYSNPAYNIHVEAFTSSLSLDRYFQTAGNQSYLNTAYTNQGGYRCSIRAWTQFENPNVPAPINHPNFWSRYMDSSVQLDNKIYSNWTDMEWPPMQFHTAPLEVVNETDGSFYLYTDQGYMRKGIWVPTGAPWSHGVCIVEFRRVCEGTGPSGISKNIDFISGKDGLLVQDTDVAFRARVTYSNEKEDAQGRWWDEGGECVDQVIRGCLNNGTCILPEVCECAEGWTEVDCSVPICNYPCLNGGFCTLPDVCTCSAGWSGFDCSEPLCAQDCNNQGICVAPDVCQCKQWDSSWVDGHYEGGYPLFRKPDGSAQLTGWTGYDCATPICTQAQEFSLIGSTPLTSLHGHGADASHSCSSVRCPGYDLTYVSSDGYNFQSGCGSDPLNSGCCLMLSSGKYECSICTTPISAPHNFTCQDLPEVQSYPNLSSIPVRFKWEDGVLRYCGQRHSPFPYYVDAIHGQNSWWYSTDIKNSTTVAPTFLCNVQSWEQGFFDSRTNNAELKGGIGSDFKLEAGRHIRVNFPNYQKMLNGTWVQGDLVRGEGVYVCANNGACIAPDTCTCADGWGGFDCNTPFCRHLRPDGSISSCRNGGICTNKDSCHCIQAESVLWKVYPDTKRGQTGWTGTDCSMPMCIQGFYDPSCTALPQAPGGEGCYRCPNNGNCTAPDVCSCAPGWMGYDCQTPICETVADTLTRIALDTVDEEKVHAFETDPCSMHALHFPRLWNGALHTRGNCTAPNLCTCTCWSSYSAMSCKKYNEGCSRPWKDPLIRYRSVLPTGSVFGNRSCIDGYEGLVDHHNRFTTCHMTIYVPTFIERRTIPIVIIAAAIGFVGTIVFFFLRRWLVKKQIRAKVARLRVQRSMQETK